MKRSSVSTHLGTWGVSPGDEIRSLGSKSPGDSLVLCLINSGSSSSPSSTEPGSITFTSGPRESNSMPFWDKSASYFRRRSTRSRSGMRLFRRLGGCGGTTRHSTPAFTQLEQGLLLSQRTLRCWHKTQLCPLVTFIMEASRLDDALLPAGGVVSLFAEPSPIWDSGVGGMVEDFQSVPNLRRVRTPLALACSRLPIASD
ncbi:hypothetical protein F4819DRAFT_93518 [Hypoxylon fuscum]|nr:hypothetical protein F4819DRAFT_93518 [Hypoxylon fuscum]